VGTRAAGWGVPDRAADPAADRPVPALDWISAARPGNAERIRADPGLRTALLAVVSASPWLARVCVTEPLALDVLSDLDGPGPPPTGSDPYDRLRTQKDLGVLRVAARDLLGLDDIEAVGSNLSDLADRLLAEAWESARPSSEGLAVIGLGKLGGGELNYASDIDLILVAGTGPPGGGEGDPRTLIDLARAAWRVDLDLRPEGRSGAMARSLASYEAYWSRWAETWEFQALLKARAVAGDPDVAGRFVTAAARHVWDRAFGADELRQVRQMKARSEVELARRGLAEREVKRGPGGIRDIEFAVQLLQLVHGRTDPTLRSASTLSALRALAAGGYVAPDDAGSLEDAYRFLRTVEHRLQLYEGQQAHTVPQSPERRGHLALVMGYRHGTTDSAMSRLDADLRRYRATARAIHERLFFRPLLEVFSFGTRGPAVPPEGGAGEGAMKLSAEAVAERLSAFGFADAARTGQAVSELTRGFSRMSQLMQRMLALLLDWLSSAPDPDQGLLGLRTLAGGQMSRDRLIAVCRESPAGAQQLCRLLGTGARFAFDLQRFPDSLAGLASGSFPSDRSPGELRSNAERSLGWRSGDGSTELGLRRFAQSERLRIAARDVLGLDQDGATGRALSDVADAVIAAALERVDPAVPFAVIGMGRLGGRELGYGSDLDLLLVYDGVGSPGAADDADAAGVALMRLIGGESPATGVYRVDLNLRPEGRQGPAVRSLESYAAYYRRWARPWERQALLRSRFVAGDQALGSAFAALVDDFVWGRPAGPGDVLEIRRSKARMEKERVPAGDDPKFHLKLGPGSTSDVEWTVQLMQLRHGIRAPGTVEALGRLVGCGALAADDGAVLADSYRFCDQARNRLGLIRDVRTDSLPVAGPVLTILARSLGRTAPGLRNDYSRVTRRARRVVERLFYGG
jgi:glutamate-ammonia-ligase adenylyltransferase